MKAGLVMLPDWMRKPWFQIAYLIINTRIKQLVERVRLPLNKKFREVVSKHVRAYVKQGKMPPEDISAAILNLADDYMAGRPMNIRAGDYIAIQNHLRKR